MKRALGISMLVVLFIGLFFVLPIVLYGSMSEGLKQGGIVLGIVVALLLFIGTAIYLISPPEH